MSTTRRGRGEGSIIQRHDHPSCPPRVLATDEDGNDIWVREKHTCKGRWAQVVDHGWNAGRRKRTTVYGRTKKEVVDKVRDMGIVTARSGYTVETWMTYWLENVAPQRCRPQTLSGYASKIRTYIVPLLGRHRIDELTAEHIEEAWQRLRKPCPRPDEETRKCGHSPAHGRAESSIRQAHAILARALTIAERREHLRKNPARQMDAPATTTNDRDRLSVDEAKLVLAEADKDLTYNARWWIALMMGPRQGEVLGLSWAMVDFDADTISIARTLVKVPGGIDFGEPKSKTSKRTIPMPSLVRERLWGHWNRYLEETGGSPDMTALVFHQAQGQPVGHKMDYERWRNLLRRAGVKHVALHSARNSTASLLEAAGVPPRLAAEITGHSDTKQLYSYQANAGLEKRREAMKAVEEAWSEGA